MTKKFGEIDEVNEAVNGNFLEKGTKGDKIQVIAVGEITHTEKPYKTRTVAYTDLEKGEMATRHTATGDALEGLKKAIEGGLTVNKDNPIVGYLDFYESYGKKCAKIVDDPPA